MQRARFCVIFALSWLLGGSSAFAQDLEKASKALTMIDDFANKLCNNPELKGKASSVEVQGKARAEASKLIKQLADLKVEGAVTFNLSDYEGLLQKDLLPALQDSTKCKQKVFDDLKDRFLPPARSQDTVPQRDFRALATHVTLAEVKVPSDIYLRSIVLSDAHSPTLYIFDPGCTVQVYVSSIFPRGGRSRYVSFGRDHPLVAHPGDVFRHKFTTTDRIFRRAMESDLRDSGYQAEATLGLQLIARREFEAEIVMREPEGRKCDVAYYIDYPP